MPLVVLLTLLLLSNDVDAKGGGRGGSGRGSRGSSGHGSGHSSSGHSSAAGRRSSYPHVTSPGGHQVYHNSRPVLLIPFPHSYGGQTGRRYRTTTEAPKLDSDNSETSNMTLDISSFNSSSNSSNDLLDKLDSLNITDEIVVEATDFGNGTCQVYNDFMVQSPDNSWNGESNDSLTISDNVVIANGTIFECPIEFIAESSNIWYIVGGIAIVIAIIIMMLISKYKQVIEVLKGLIGSANSSDKPRPNVVIPQTT